jgi:putative chitobiose transport system substrate-binding protein
LKRFLLGFCFVSILTLMGCQSQPQQSSVSNDHIELEFWTLQMLNFKDYMENMIHAYEKTHPNVTIRWVDVPMSEGEKKAITAMLANKTPDVINLNPDFSAILASRNTLLDMNEFVTPEQQKTFLPVAWQAATLDKKTFGIPWYLSSAVTLYNTDILKKAGMVAPPETTEAMAKMAAQVKNKTKMYLLFPTISSGGRFFRMLQKQDIPIWDDQGRLIFADNGADKALRFWVDLYKKEAVPPESITEDNQAAVDRYQSGTLGLLLTGPNFLNIVKENAPQIFQKTNVAPQFPAQSKYMDFSEMLLVVPSRTKHPKEAVEFALYVANAKNTLKLSELAPVLPPQTAALNSSAFRQTYAKDILIRARSVSAAQLMSAKTVFKVHPMQKRLNELMDFYVQSALLGKMTPEDAMKKAQADMNDLVALH